VITEQQKEARREQRREYIRQLKSDPQKLKEHRARIARNMVRYREKKLSDPVTAEQYRKNERKYASAYYKRIYENPIEHRQLLDRRSKLNKKIISDCAPSYVRGILRILSNRQLKPADIPDELVQTYRELMLLRRALKQNKKNQETKKEQKNEEDATAPSSPRSIRSPEHGQPVSSSANDLRVIQRALRESRKP